MLFDEAWLTSRLMLLIPLIMSLSVHEWAHAWSAWQLGDDTAARQGRLTLNPIAHLDPVGSLLLPLLGIPFGWAKPVPVNPSRFRREVNMRLGSLLTAAAGPLSNVCLGVVSVVLFALQSDHTSALATLLSHLALLNFALAIFNALPIPPLDGSHVFDALVPESLRPLWERFCAVGPVVLITLLVLPMVSGFNLLGLPYQAMFALYDAVQSLVGT